MRKLAFILLGLLLLASPVAAQEILSRVPLAYAPYSLTLPQFRITAGLTQTGNPLEVRDSSGNTVCYMSPTGTGFCNSFLALRLNNVRYCDQFPGADAGAKIAACIADLPATGGIADARGFEGAQDAAASIVINKPGMLLICGITLTGGAAANPVITGGNDAVIEGCSWDTTTVQSMTAGNDGISISGKNRSHVRGLQVKQTAAVPTGTGIVANLGQDNSISDVHVTGFRDGIVSTSTSKLELQDALSILNKRDGIRIVGTLATANVDSYLRRVYTQLNTVNGLLIDGNVSNAQFRDTTSSLNATGILIQSVVGTGTPAQLNFSDVLADSNTVNGWYATAGTQITLDSPWSSNLGTTNFYWNGVSSVFVTNPRLFNFKGHGFECVTCTAFKIMGGFVNDNGQNVANTKDAINISGGGIGVGIAGVSVGNANLRYAVNIAGGESQYHLEGNDLTAGGTGTLNDAAASATRVILGNPGVTNYLPNKFSSLTIDVLSIDAVGILVSDGIDNSVTFQQDGPFYIKNPAAAIKRVTFNTPVNKATTANTDIFVLNSLDAANPLQIITELGTNAVAGSRFTGIQSAEAGVAFRDLILQRGGGKVGIGMIGAAKQLDVGGTGITSTLYSTKTDCVSIASPAVCGAAPAGSVVIAAAATTITVNTTAVTAASEFFLQEDSSLGTKLSVTCNTTIVRTYTITARTPATSFVITASAAPVANPACLNYFIMN